MSFKVLLINAEGWEKDGIPLDQWVIQTAIQLLMCVLDSVPPPPPSTHACHTAFYVCLLSTQEHVGYLSRALACYSASCIWVGESYRYHRTFENDTVNNTQCD